MRRNPVIMMCYKDKTWCSYSFMCGNSSCDKRLDGEELKKAIEWWGGLDFPAVYGDFKTDDCGWRDKYTSGENGELTDE